MRRCFAYAVASLAVLAMTSQARPPAKGLPFQVLEGTAEQFQGVRKWRSYYWRDDFTFVLLDDAGKLHRVISREPTPWTDLRLGTTYTAGKVDWSGKPRVRVIGVLGVDRTPAEFDDVKLDDKVVTAFILRVRSHNDKEPTWPDYYVNNWFHDWGAETNRKVLPYYANSDPHYTVYGFVAGSFVPFDEEGKQLLSRFDPDYGGIIYHGRIVPAKNDIGHAIHVLHLMGRHKKSAEYKVFYGDASQLIKLDNKPPADPKK